MFAKTQYSVPAVSMAQQKRETAQTASQMTSRSLPLSTGFSQMVGSLTPRQKTVQTSAMAMKERCLLSEMIELYCIHLTAVRMRKTGARKENTVVES